MPEQDGSSWWFGQPAGAHGRPGKDAAPGETAGDADSPRPPATAAVPLPSISLPTGGGAIKGIGEKLTIGASGTAQLTVPVFTSAARNGFAPRLELAYDSGSGNGPFGFGWSMPVPSVTRKTALGLPRYADGEDSDIFVLSGAEDLIPLLVPADDGGWVPDPVAPVATGSGTFSVRRYRPRVEAGFARVERWQDTATGDAHWRTVTRDNVTSLYGQDAGSRIADPANPAHVFSWLLDLSYDDRGNAVSYVYKPEDPAGVPARASEAGRQAAANRYLKRVCYGNDTPYRPALDATAPTQWCFQVVLDYGEHNAQAPTPAEDTPWACRADPFSTYRAGFEIRTYRTCQRILMFHQFPADLGVPAALARSTDLGYLTAGEAPDPRLPGYSQLGSVAQTGWVAQPKSAGISYQTARLPPVEFQYCPLLLDGTLRIPGPDDLAALSGDFDGTRQRWVDLDGEGLQGVLTEGDGAWYYQRNRSAFTPGGGPPGARLAPLEQVATRPASLGTPLQLTDLNGDGHLSAVSFDLPVAGWYERDDQEGWTPFRPMAGTANVDWASPNVRFIDLDGDGLADLLVTEDEVFTWYQWQAAAGFGPPATVRKPFDEDQGPALLLADGTGSIFLADMSGDGLTDLVRVRNREVCYWPNLGYGRFGGKVTMDGAPVLDFPDRFDPRRVLLADADGSGTADLLYAGPDGATLWFNESGNGWTAGSDLPQLPAGDGAAQVTVMDLLGAGTACVVWTSPLPADGSRPLRYIDLTGGVKPYLLTGISNNLGASTALSYAPSTKFYVQDDLAGDAWVTRLPFPVHVVERVAVTEGVSRTSLVSGYSYHHGYYDGTEREFRGFARVDQVDAESVPEDSGTGTFTATPVVAGDEFTLPPVRTRTWYHTGAYFGGEDIAARLSGEYYALDPQAPRLAGTVLPEGASSDECRQACRALRGRMLRQEVYADDATPASASPYVTSEHRYQAALLQPAAGPGYAGGAYAGVYAWELESITCPYERDLADPSVTHRLTLAVDAYGNVTSSAAAGYQRRAPAFAEQAATHVTYQEADFANVGDQPGWYRIGLPVETRSYELTGVNPDPAVGRYDPAALLAAAGAAPVIPYEQVATGTSAQRRLLKRNRTVYRHDDLSGPLPLGEAESLALVDVTYQLCFTSGLLTQVYGTKLTAADLAAEIFAPGSGRYQDLDGDGCAWCPSARTFYSPDPGAPDPVFAAAHFYLPQGVKDPWDGVARVGYDAHDLLVTQTTDAAGNVIQAAGNYRVLAPWLVTDANLNRSGVRYDPLGMVAATAAMGKLLPGGTDEGDHLDASTAEPSAGDDPTTRLDYDLGAYQAWAADPGQDPDHPAPAWARASARVRHKDPATPWLQAYTYTDGHGRVALAKAQAEPGDAPLRDGSGQLMHNPDGSLVTGHTDTRWVGTGRVVYDNKGHPVKAYEPFFDSSPAYDDETDLVQWGVTAITRYDPLGRAVRVDNPNGTYRTVEFDAWRQVTSDENDTVLGSAWYAAREARQLGDNEADAAAKAAAHADTPALADLDTLGRTFRTVADNGPQGQYPTTLTLDIEGNVRATTDAAGRVVLTQDYNMAGAEVHRVSVDAGERWLVPDAGGQHLLGWDSRGQRIRAEYDELRRPVGRYVTAGSAAERLAERVSYGEALTLADAQARNLRGAVYQHSDEAGVAATTQRDFKGNVLTATRQLLADYRDDIDWAGDPALEAETFTAARGYDALSRVITVTTPDASVTSNAYNERSLLAGVTVSLRGGAAAGFVTGISYDAKGQRQVLSYGNGAVTTYAYDPETFRLTGLATTRASGPGQLQDLSYTYDPVGNTTRLGDAAQQVIFFANQVVSPNADYTCDAVYRLTDAVGREHVGQAGQQQPTWDDSPRIDVPLPTDGQAMRGYTEHYAYDPAGNFQGVTHVAANGNWTRSYANDPASNRLTATTVGAATDSYSYDGNGNITAMPHLTLMAWNWKDELHATSRQPAGTGTPQATYYRYDAAGQRARKATDDQNASLVRQRIYLGGYEVYREYSPAGTLTLERQSLHIGDGQRLICLAETTTVDTASGGAPVTVSRYQFGNHLGSAVLELDASAAVLTYEEYYPYGSTSYQTGSSQAEVSLKRYRYTGRERDEESGFSYHGARYYTPWLGRWTSCDPAGAADGSNLYSYARWNPVRFSDAQGMAAEDDRARAQSDLAHQRYGGANVDPYIKGLVEHHPGAVNKGTGWETILPSSRPLDIVPKIMPWKSIKFWNAAARISGEVSLAFMPGAEGILELAPASGRLASLGRAFRQALTFAGIGTSSVSVGEAVVGKDLSGEPLETEKRISLGLTGAANLTQSFYHLAAGGLSKFFSLPKSANTLMREAITASDIEVTIGKLMPQADYVMLDEWKLPTGAWVSSSELLQLNEQEAKAATDVLAPKLAERYGQRNVLVEARTMLSNLEIPAAQWGEVTGGWRSSMPPAPGLTGALPPIRPAPEFQLMTPVPIKTVRQF
ncbi:MAG: SpvB/TcaC N-terminal domain-containing protein [Trebonia sp.]